MPPLIGLDVGTSATKAILIDNEGRVLKSVERVYPMAIPQPGWAEQNPEDWAQAAKECLDELGSDDVQGIGLTGQMHGSVFLDAQNKVVRPALLWCDQRTADECREIELAVGAERLRALTGNPALTGFQLPKLLWLRNHEPENFKRTESMLLPKDYIRFILTGEKATEPSDASGIGCLDVKNRSWSTEVLSTLSLSREILPKLAESASNVGEYQNVSVAAGGGDQAAGAVGTGTITPGILSLSLGTSGVVFEAFDDPIQDQVDPIHNFCHATGKWHRMGVMLSCGGAVRWARDVLYGSASSYDAWNQEALRIPAGCDGLSFLPHLAGERCPFVDPHARGGWVGLGMHHTRGHLARAVMEGVCLTLLQCSQLMRPGRPQRVRVTGGGAKSDLWLQMVADVFESPVEVLEADEGPAFGAALLAGVASGVWATLEEAVGQTVRVQRTVEPSHQNYDEFKARHARIQSLRDAWAADI